MKKRILTLLALAIGLCSLSATALDENGKRYIERLVKGGPESIRDTAESLYQTGTTDPEVLDVAAEVLAQKYNVAAGSFGYTDGMAWLCRALGASGNARYKTVLMQVVDGAENRKLRGHCSKAAKSFPKKSDVPQYTVGTIDLQKLREPPPPPPPPAAPAPTAKPAKGAKAAAPAAPAKPAVPAAPAAPAAKAVDFSLIREGMSSQEVTDLIGPPTAQSQRMTGKQFNPFNYGARDLQRMNFLYKGVGHIEFSLKSAYNGVFRVIAIVSDPNETGYP